MTLKIVHVRCTNATSSAGPIEMAYNELYQSFNQATPAANTAEFPNAVSIPEFSGTAGSNRYIGRMDFDPFIEIPLKLRWRKFFRVLKTRTVQIEPGKTVYWSISKKPYVFDIDQSYGVEQANNAGITTPTALLKGSEFCSVGFWGNLTADTVPLPAYSEEQLVMRVLHRAKVAKTPTNIPITYNKAIVGTYGTNKATVHEWGANAVAPVLDTDN